MPLYFCKVVSSRIDNKIVDKMYIGDPYFYFYFFQTHARFD